MKKTRGAPVRLKHIDEGEPFRDQCGRCRTSKMVRWADTSWGRLRLCNGCLGDAAWHSKVAREEKAEGARKTRPYYVNPVSGGGIETNRRRH